jgi:hypothetical protein
LLGTAAALPFAAQAQGAADARQHADRIARLHCRQRRGAGLVGLPGRSSRVEVRQTNRDAIVSLKGVASFGEERRWLVPCCVDVGIGQSKLTWRALAGVGHSFDWATVTAAWRCLACDFDSDWNLKDITFSGPFVGLTSRW